jgi:phenylalanyl-tRNA synthetase beta chain
MPTVTLNRQVVETLVGKKISTTRLKERIAMLGTDVERIDNKEIVVEVFPNRPDMLSEQGFARAFRSFLCVKKGLEKYKIKKSGFKVNVDSSVSMRPYTACAIVKNITFTSERIREIMQVQEKLATTHGRNRKKSEYGIYPLAKIKFPISYVAKNPASIRFKPLGFNYEMTGKQVEKVHPTGKKYSFVAQGWKKYPCYVDANGSILSMLPYTNSQDTGRIDESTTEVFVECTGTDFNNVHTALVILVTTLADMGGTIYTIDMEYPDKKVTTPNLSPRKMRIDYDYINKRLGLSLSRVELHHRLEQMGFGVKGNKALIPTYRADILHQSDLVEDIAIAHGYEHITADIPRVATIAEEHPLYRFKHRLLELFIGMGMQEMRSYHLTSEEDLSSKMNLPSSSIVRLKNSLVEYGCMRNSIVPGMLKILAQNQHHDYPQHIFEVGTIFNINKKSVYNIHEQESLAIVASGDKVDFTTVRQFIDLLVRVLGIKAVVKEEKHSSFIPGRVASLRIKKKQIAVFGEIHPRVLAQWNITMPVAAAEVDVEELFLHLPRKGI